MRRTQARSPEQALIYLLDCALATVSDYASKKSTPKHEMIRQIQIAQSNLDWCIIFCTIEKGSRAEEVINNHNHSVEEWANTFRV